RPRPSCPRTRRAWPPAPAPAPVTGAARPTGPFSPTPPSCRPTVLGGAHEPAALARPGDAGLHVVHEHLDGDVVAPALRHDQVGVLLRGLDVEVVHRLDRAAVLVDHALGAAPALGDVALEAADEALVGRRVDEHLEVEAAPHLRLVEHEDALDHDDRRRLEPQ